MHACTQWTHSEVWSQLATTPEGLFKIGDRQSEKKWRNGDRRAICDAMRGLDAGRRVIRPRGVSDGSDGARPLWRSNSARTEIFFADEPHMHKLVIGGAAWRHPRSGCQDSWKASVPATGIEVWSLRVGVRRTWKLLDVSFVLFCHYLLFFSWIGSWPGINGIGIGLTTSPWRRSFAVCRICQMVAIELDGLVLCLKGLYDCVCKVIISFFVSISFFSLILALSAQEVYTSRGG